MPASIGPDLTLRVPCFEHHKNPTRRLEDFERTDVIHQSGNTKRRATRDVWVHGIIDCAAKLSLSAPNGVASLRCPRLHRRRLLRRKVIRQETLWSSRRRPDSSQVRRGGSLRLCRVQWLNSGQRAERKENHG